MKPKFKTRTLLFPTLLIDYQVSKLQRDLRRILQSYRRNKLSKLDCLTLGNTIIQQSQIEMQREVTKYLSKHRVKPSIVLDENRLSDTLTRWDRLVNDF